MKRIQSLIQCAFQSLLAGLCKRFDAAMLRSPCFKGRAVYGPVRSRRLGYVLGINAMKCKMCSYDCIYCQAGQTACRSNCRESCIGAYELYCVVRKKLEMLAAQAIPIDCIAFMPQGEPTLDDDLAQKIRLLREFGYKIAVISNASLLGSEKLQEDLMLADYVSLKVDTVNADTWRRLNRPHSRLDFEAILDGVRRFAHRYRGTLATETMLVKGFNDSAEEIEAVGRFLESIPRSMSYFTLPHRPAVESHAVPPEPQVLSGLSELIQARISRAQTQFTSEEDVFFGAGEPEDALLAALSAQPMKAAAVDRFASLQPKAPRLVTGLLEKGLIRLVSHHQEPFYVIQPQPATKESRP